MSTGQVGGHAEVRKRKLLDPLVAERLFQAPADAIPGDQGDDRKGEVEDRAFQEEAAVLPGHLLRGLAAHRSKLRDVESWSAFDSVRLQHDVAQVTDQLMQKSSQRFDFGH